jgi:hypothetical protein
MSFLATGSVNKTVESIYKKKVEENMGLVKSKFQTFRKLQEDLLTEGYEKKRATELLKLVNALTNCISTYQEASGMVSQNVCND